MGKEVKKTKKTNQESINQEKALAVTLIVLAILVIILLLIALVQKNKTEQREKSHITIPVLEENTESSISIDLNELKEEKEYIFIVSNYKNKQINKRKLDYDIEIINKDNISIELYKNDKLTKVINTEYELEDNILSKDKKQEDIYKIVIKDASNIVKGSKLLIEIDS